MCICMCKIGYNDLLEDVGRDGGDEGNEAEAFIGPLTRALVDSTVGVDEGTEDGVEVGNMDGILDGTLLEGWVNDGIDVGTLLGDPDG